MSKTVTVLPKATVIRQGYDGVWKEYAITAVHLDANVNMYGDPLHELHAVDSWGQGAWWFETTDSLKATFDEAVLP